MIVGSFFHFEAVFCPEFVWLLKLTYDPLKPIGANQDCVSGQLRLETCENTSGINQALSSSKPEIELSSERGGREGRREVANIRARE